jgi:hypothetical protein
VPYGVYGTWKDKRKEARSAVSRRPLFVVAATSEEEAIRLGEEGGVNVKYVILESDRLHEEKEAEQRSQERSAAESQESPAERKQRRAGIAALICGLPILPVNVVGWLVDRLSLSSAVSLALVGFALFCLSARQSAKYDIVSVHLPDTGPGSIPFGVRQMGAAAFVFGIIFLLLGVAGTLLALKE